MKRIWLGFALVAFFALSAPAQDKPGQPAQKEESDGMIGWQWANFIVLAAGLGYLMAKTLPPLFRSRGEEIRKGIDEAAKMKQEAEAKAAEIDRRLAGLSTEIDKLGAEIRAEMNAEGERIARETDRQIEKLKQQAEQEITFQVKAAQLELKRYSVELATTLAAQRIQSRMTHATQQALVASFVAGIAGDGHPGKLS